LPFVTGLLNCEKRIQIEFSKVRKRLEMAIIAKKHQFFVENDDVFTGQSWGSYSREDRFEGQ
jgi:hypothetical protein